MASDDRTLRDHLIELLRGGSAHVDARSALADFPVEQRSAKPSGSPHNGWQLLEHTRLALEDILQFCTDAQYVARKWPDSYWPSNDAPVGEEWDHSVAALLEGIEAFEKLVGSGDSNLYATIPWGEGQTLLREVLLAADHTSYHLGQIVLLRKQLGSWQG